MSAGRKANGRFAKGGTKKRRRGGGGSRTIRSRRGVGHAPVRLVESAGKVLVVYGATLAPFDNGDGPINQLKMGNYAQALDEANPLQMVPVIGPALGLGGAGVSDGKRQIVAAGAVTWGAAKLYRRVHPSRSTASRWLGKALHIKNARFA